MNLEKYDILEITSVNKVLILKSLELINYISNEPNIKVGYIKILSNLLKFHQGIENYFNLLNSINLDMADLDINQRTIEEFDRIKSSLKENFKKNGYSSEKAEEFYILIENIENNIFEIFKDQEIYEFNNYLIQLINDKKIEEFIWLNTIYNIYMDRQSLKDIVTDYRTFNQIEFSDLYKMYLFVTDYNINNLLLMGESEFIGEEYLSDINNFFDYMYLIIDDMRTFVAKEDKKNILSISSKIQSYTNLKTPDKEEFLAITKKIYGVMNDLFENDNTKLFLDNVYPILVKSFYAPLKNNDKIKYDFNLDFLYALEYLQIIMEVMSDKDE